MKFVVSDTTPVHYLVLIGEIDVLRQLFGKLLIPPAVVEEMRHPGAPLAVAAWASSLPSWAEVRSPINDLRLRMGRGENAAISLAAELTGSALLADDRKARREAQRRGIVAIGTLAILDLGDEMGLVDFEESVSRLLATNFRVEATLIQQLRDKIRARKRV